VFCIAPVSGTAALLPSVSASSRCSRADAAAGLSARMLAERARAAAASPPAAAAAVGAGAVMATHPPLHHGFAVSCGIGGTPSKGLLEHQSAETHGSPGLPTIMLQFCNATGYGAGQPTCIQQRKQAGCEVSGRRRPEQEQAPQRRELRPEHIVTLQVVQQGCICRCHLQWHAYMQSDYGKLQP
jgi:hypothetical protein